MRPFGAPETTLGDLDAAAAGSLLSVANDITLIIDAQGVVRDISSGSEDLTRETLGEWVGRNWVDVVTQETSVARRLFSLLGDFWAAERSPLLVERYPRGSRVSKTKTSRFNPAKKSEEGTTKNEKKDARSPPVYAYGNKLCDGSEG